MNYEIIKQIGEGGFGRVYQAKHKILDELACLKENIYAEKDSVDLLKTEAKLLWKLDEHHSIPSIKDLFLVDDTHAVMVMSYIQGKTLDDLVKENGRVHPEDASWITERLLGALYYCHYYGVIHSDIKPQNVFVEPDKHDIKLIDFGLSVYKPSGNTKPKGYTELYAAPELQQGRPPIPETDLYGAGIILLSALGGSPASKTLPSDTPEPLGNFCKELLKYDPRDRPNWGENLIQRLSDIRQEVFGRRHTSESP